MNQLQIIEKLNKGVQMGLVREVQVDSKKAYFFYAIQKYRDIYYVYESLILDSKAACEEYEYETVKKYVDVEEVINNYNNKYRIKFDEIKVCRGQKVFDVRDYID